MFGLSEKATGWVLKVAFVGLCVGAVWANFKILDAKNQRISDQKTLIETRDNQIKEKDDEIKQLKEDAKKKAQSDEVTETVKAGVKQAEEKPIQAKTKAQQYVEGKLDAINKKYAALPPSAANDQRKATEISLERAKGLWLTYCLQEPKVVACTQ